MDRLSELLGHHVQFRYTAWDRIVLNGYLDRLQRPENIVYFFREVVGAPCVTPEVLMSRTAPYRAWVARYAEERGIPLLVAPKDVRKEDLVVPSYQGFKAAEGVVCILTKMRSGGRNAGVLLKRSKRPILLLGCAVLACACPFSSRSGLVGALMGATNA